MDLDLEALKERLEALEASCPTSSLVIYAPDDEQGRFFEGLCRAYVDASPRQRRLICAALADKPGISNHLLGYVWQVVERLRASGDVSWLRMGLAAAAMQQGGYDPRDELLALAELYVTAEEVGIDPRPAVEAIGGVPSNFEQYAVVRSRRGRGEQRVTG